MWKDNTIKRRIMTAITAKINAAQEKFEEGCKDIDLNAELQKANLADKLVNDITSKFL